MVFVAVAVLGAVLWARDRGPHRSAVITAGSGGATSVTTVSTNTNKAVTTAPPPSASDTPSSVSIAPPPVFSATDETTTTSPASPCTSGEVAVQVSASDAALGSPVSISYSYTNVSDHPCTHVVSLRQDYPDLEITDSSGTLVYTDLCKSMCPLPPAYPESLAPGQTISRRTTWDQHRCINRDDCANAQVATGQYTATETVESSNDPPHGSATFNIAN